ncbi:MAG: hypothetical protein M3209_09535 [Acidobacteriota bacterium]|nr:hypothetical protein [Acidobacteriota bacterium]
MGVYARKSFGDPYLCQFPWTCFVQCGSSGVVFKSRSIQDAFDAPVDAIKEAVEGDEEKVYRTAFFEAFPKNPDTFIRGEGASIEEAEKKAWDEFERISNCSNHEFERRGYTNGAGFCCHCGMFSGKAFEPSEVCVICGANTYYTSDVDNKWYCAEHESLIPEEKLRPYQKWMRDYLSAANKEIL